MTYSNTDAVYLEDCRRGELKLTESFLIESRAQRIGCSESELRAMRRYELCRELADEESIVLQQDSEFIPPAWIDWELVNAMARSETKERMAAFARFIESEKEQSAGKLKSKDRT